MIDKDDINDFELPGGGFDPENNGFKIPEGYFNLFSDKLFSKIELENELKEFKILASIEKKNAFSIPSNYFEEASQVVSVKADWQQELLAYPKLSALSNVYPSIAPEGYFEEANELLSERIAAFQEINEFETLSSLSKLNCFALPQNYFDTVLDAVRDRIHAPQAATIWDKISEIIFSKKVAYAFGVIMIAVFSLFYYLNQETTVVKSDCGQLACLDKKEILNSSFVNQLDEETISGMIDEDALTDSLSQNNSTTDNELLENVDASNIIDEL